MKTSEMPVVRPVPIPTKDKPWYKRIWTWFSSVREWEVVEDFTFLWHGITLLIPAGFIFNGASIPRIFWSVLSPTGLLFIPGLFHDFGYRYDFIWELLPDGTRQRIRVGAGKACWDWLFRHMGEEINGVHFVNSVAWIALKVGGGFAWASHHSDHIGAGMEASDKLPPVEERGDTPT